MAACDVVLLYMAESVGKCTLWTAVTPRLGPANQAESRKAERHRMAHLSLNGYSLNDVSAERCFTGSSGRVCRLSSAVPADGTCMHRFAAGISWEKREGLALLSPR